MKNKIGISIFVLFVGILIGGVSFYALQKASAPQKGFGPAGPPQVPKQIIETSRAFSEIASVVSPAVVNISTTKVVKRDDPFWEDPFYELFSPFRNFRMPKKWKEQSLGSGVIVSADGYIITNNHVVEHADEIRVTLYDKRSFRAKVVGVDAKTDVAVVKISEDKLPTVRWGDSDRLQVGEFVLAVGNPFGLSHTVTMGIISAVGRANVGIADYEDFIQTDAAINPGNSGGPLVNIQGEIIGINTAIFSRSGGYQGIGFAVPSNMAKLVMNQLVERGKVTRGWLGVTIQELTPELAQKFGLTATKGALIGDVAKGSPAEKAGLKRGDVILALNGKKVSDVGNLRNMVAQSRVGAEIPLTVMRGGKELSITVVIAELPKDAVESLPGAAPDERGFDWFSGLTVIDLTREIARQLGLHKDEKGVVVVRVEPGSAVEEGDIRKGDVIQEIDRRKIENLGEYNKAISEIKPGNTVLLFVNRGGRRFYVTLRAD